MVGMSSELEKLATRGSGLLCGPLVLTEVCAGQRPGFNSLTACDVVVRARTSAFLGNCHSDHITGHWCPMLHLQLTPDQSVESLFQSAIAIAVSRK